MIREEQAPHASINRRLRLAAGAVLLLALVWNFWLPFAQDYFDQVTKPPLPPNVDFFAYITAGQRFNDGANPYYYGEAQPGSALISEYLYPPTALPFFGALARMPYQTARVAWLVLYTLIDLAAFAALAFSLARGWRLTFICLGLGLTFTSFPLLMHIRNGQADVLVVGLMLLSLAAYARGWRALSAIVLALAALLKVSPAILLIFFVLTLRDWRFLLYFALAAVGWVGASLLAGVPFRYYPEYVQYILPVVSAGTGYYLNQSLVKYLANSPALAQAVSAAGILLFAGFAFWRGRRVEPAALRAPWGEGAFTPLALFTLNLAVILIFQGKAWSMAYVWMILPAALILTLLLHRRAALWQVALAGLAAFLMVSKIYGYPPLDSLNLFGSALMTGLLIYLAVDKKHGGVYGDQS